MKVALVTTPPSERSAVASYAWSLAPHLRRRCEIEIFVASECSGTSDDGMLLRDVAELSPRDFDHIVYQIGNEAEHAFMLPFVRALGGTIVLHEWSLPDLCAAAYPSLARGGWSAFAAAWREGGMRDARRRLASSGDRGELALNRSVVRGGDTFVVHDEALKRRILADRNAPTPIAVLPREPLAELAARYVEFLDACPAPRSKKKSLIRAMVEASDRRRSEASQRDEASRDAPSADARRTEARLDFVDVPTNE